MTNESENAHAAIALGLINAAFANRAPPLEMTDSKQLSDLEFAEVMSFEGLHWQDITFDLIDRNSDVAFWLAPEAFCFYLPGILAAGLKENRWETNAYDALITFLDRSPDPDAWDDFFLPRWPLLTVEEIDAVAAWARWLSVVQPDAAYENTYERVQDTLTLLKLQAQDAEPPR